MWVIYDCTQCTWYAKARSRYARVCFYPTVLFMEHGDEIFLPHPMILRTCYGEMAETAKLLSAFTLRRKI